MITTIGDPNVVYVVVVGAANRFRRRFCCSSLHVPMQLTLLLMGGELHKTDTIL